MARRPQNKISAHPVVFVLSAVVAATVTVFGLIYALGMGTFDGFDLKALSWSNIWQALPGEEVSLEVVSADVTDYPTVRLYLTAHNAKGEAVALDGAWINLLEGISSGEQLNREVTSFAQLAGREGVSYDLVVDKSGSMGDDMGRVRTILSEFVGTLDFSTGDAAELISFDSFVMYLCTYTSDAQLLLNGIANMEAWGETALYDALYEGIGNAGVRGGARCVICFTDGQDNSSAHSAQDCVALATSNSVPVFIVGVGDVDRATLEDICAQTGGSYWSIEDVADLATILGDIATSEQNLYCVEYVSDAQSSADALRDVSVSMRAGLRKGRASASVTPTAAAPAQTHESRYELVVGDIPWTEANAAAMQKGGHLVTITSQDEMNAIVGMAEAAGLRFVWMGGYTSVRDNQAFGHWVTGEAFDFTAWREGEPSRNDLDGTPEMYLELWHPKDEEPWTWNDERNAPYEDPVSNHRPGETGYVIEYEDVVEQAASTAEPATYAADGFSVTLPAAVGADPDVAWDAGARALTYKGVQLAWFDLDSKYWDGSLAPGVYDTRDLPNGKLELSMGDDSTLFGSYTEASGKRITIGTRLCAASADDERYLAADVYPGFLALQAAASGADASADPQRIAEDFLVICAGGMTL